ncbi:hypothetical protein [uncultured Rhodoferax sp.]|uniref:hypothetical protein n=1 Tax=uncultured Rhodoferax sp. TaxID=223188 RepID=UPI0025D62E37|nr:hypothetical protein [uncultured Rhodoferax sp.]
MVDPIVPRDTIRAQAVAAANSGQNVNRANPYPAGSAASELFIDEFMRLHFVRVRAENFRVLEAV